MKNYLLLLLALPLLLACSSEKDEPYLAVCPAAPSFFLGTWEVTEISNVDNVAPMKWDNWKDYYGRIFIKFNDDGTCDTYYQDSSKEVAESTLPKFPYIFSQFTFNGEDKIFCFEPEYPGVSKAVLAIQKFNGNDMEVVLEGGIYCLQSSYSDPRLYLKLKRKS